MKKNALNTIGRAALAILMLTVFAQIPASAQDKGNEAQSSERTQENASTRRENTRKLEGVWNLQITRLDCQTGAVIGTGPAILTFVRGGIMHEFGTGRSPSTRSPGYGVWSYHSNGQYTSAFQFFRFNADGTLAGRQINRPRIELSHDGNSYTSTSTAQVLDTGGNVIANNCSTGTATRFVE